VKKNYDTCFTFSIQGHNSVITVIKENKTMKNMNIALLEDTPCDQGCLSHTREIEIDL
jgi:hypothetical protein